MEIFNIGSESFVLAAHPTISRDRVALCWARLARPIRMDEGRCPETARGVTVSKDRFAQ
jgi:hypothetical protein